MPREEDVPADFPLEKCLSNGKTLYRAVGCRNCRGTGYRGRTGVFELLVGDDEIRRLVTDGAPIHVIQKAAVKAGMRTLREDGWIRSAAE